jgi:iron complex outermembrane receptor protein
MMGRRERSWARPGCAASTATIWATRDLAAIQVAKGYSSVAYGANTLGGAINLVSRKPGARREGDAAVGFAQGGERQASANVGSNQGLWYLQAGLSYIDSDSFPLASRFRPTATEDGGARNNAYRKDHKLSFKVGLTLAAPGYLYRKPGSARGTGLEL